MQKIAKTCNIDLITTSTLFNIPKSKNGNKLLKYLKQTHHFCKQNRKQPYFL